MSRRTPPLVPRLRPHAESVFAEMSRLALEVGAVNLGQGFPDTDGPVEIKEVAIAAINDGRGNQYPPSIGIPELRHAIASHQERFYGISLDPNTDVVVTTGASEAIAATLIAVVDAGDEVVMFEPWFDIYAAAISIANGTRIGVPMSGPELRPDIDALRAAITPKTKLIIINSPHNPTGVIFTLEELKAVATIAIQNDILVLSDEAYEHLWFDEHEHIPISTLPGMFERTITVGSGGKSCSFTGWQVGWASGSRDLIAALRTALPHLSFVSGGPFQYAMAHGLGLPDQYSRELRSDLALKRDLLCGGLEELGFGVIRPQGTYFATTDVRPLGYTDGLAFCRELPHKAGVVAIPHGVFCDDPEVGRPYVRWAFCKRTEVLNEALDRLRAGLS
ncbi:MAG: aminotransferase class I/II-fold pyridoxal phosphate-dependent enzyme [Actinomycetes bacterium]